MYFFLLRDGKHALGERATRKKTLLSIFQDKPAKPFKANLRRAGPEAAHLIGAMLAGDADSRPGAAEALTHPLFMTLLEKVRQRAHASALPRFALIVSPCLTWVCQVRFIRRIKLALDMDATLKARGRAWVRCCCKPMFLLLLLLLPASLCPSSRSPGLRPAVGVYLGMGAHVCICSGG